MKKEEILKLVRIVIYGGYLLGLSLVFLYDAQPQQGDKFTEFSLTEYFQEGSFLLTVLIFLYNTLKRKSTAALSILIGGFFLMALIREFDAFLDAWVFDGAWQLLAFSVLILVIYSIFKNRRQLNASIPPFMVSFPFGIMVTGFLVTFAYSRLIGEPVMWETVMEEGYMRSVKNAVEESIELLGDSLILFSAIEYHIWAKRQETIN